MNKYSYLRHGPKYRTQHVKSNIERRAKQYYSESGFHIEERLSLDILELRIKQMVIRLVRLLIGYLEQAYVYIFFERRNS